MKVNLLNTIVVFERKTETTDAIGSRLSTWNLYYTCHATISGESGQKLTEAGLVLDDSDMTVTIRYCRKAAVITTTGYRLKLNDEIYSIEHVDHMNFKMKSLKFKCRKEDHYGQTHQGQNSQG